MDATVTVMFPNHKKHCMKKLIYENGTLFLGETKCGLKFPFGLSRGYFLNLKNPREF
jgi:hypothetical protein